MFVVSRTICLLVSKLFEQINISKSKEYGIHCHFEYFFSPRDFFFREASLPIRGLYLYVPNLVNELIIAIILFVLKCLIMFK